MKNPYETVTARIIEALAAGVIPWAKPWKDTGTNNPFPRNFKTGAQYRGANVLILWSSPYTSPHWLTFKQAMEIGGTVRKGEKGTQILFWKIAKRDEEGQAAEADTKNRELFVCRSYTVFNTEQCDDLRVPKTMAALPEVDRDEECESIICGWEARPTLQLDNVHEGRAYYRPSTDTVHMPTRNRFVDGPHYYATLFHELVHSTGHESRLARERGASFGDDLYGKEELIAEMGGSFLCAIAGIANERTEVNATAYIQSWIEVLKGDSRLVITAASAAQRAADAISGYSFEAEAEDDTAGETGDTGSLPLAA